ncbi:F-box protein At2g27310-like [Henckelia pumila]|uniref:F-box protein At2g27310-like n=1 Tax=Henckelia pumila TaxID=405737 RepID=UPI003C6DD09A
MFPTIINAFRAKSTGDKADIPLDIIQTHILNRLDGATLASAGCASTQFHALCSDDQLWRNICNSTWPSTTHPRVVRAMSAFTSAHRSFYIDAFSSMHHQLVPKTTLLSELISAVDIYYKDEVIYSKVLATETAGDWFLDNPLILRLLVTTPRLRIHGGKGKTCMSLQAKEHLRVSWIVIDPNNKRALNVASQKAVHSSIEGDDTILVRYSKVAAVSRGKLVQWAVLVTCSRREETGEVEVEEVKMHMEDRLGKSLSGRDGLRILHAAMQGRRRRSDWRMEKYHYEIFSDSKLYGSQMNLLDTHMLQRISSIMSLGMCVLSIFLYLVRGKKSSYLELAIVMAGASAIIHGAFAFMFEWLAADELLFCFDIE